MPWMAKSDLSSRVLKAISEVHSLNSIEFSVKYILKRYTAMKVLLQRVTEASVKIDDVVNGRINQGLLLLVGIEREDSADVCRKMAEKVLSYRLFSDADGKMNLNIKQVEGGILAISQFTLAADTKKGLRPGFSKAATPEQAKTLYEGFVDDLKALHGPIETGIFAADMKVSLVNDGPVTLLLEM